jgi:hypothetical protein
LTPGDGFAMMRAMRRIPLLMSAALLAAGLAGCQKDDSAIVAKLDEISTKLDKLDKLDAIAAGRPGAGRPGGAEAGRPDPTSVYAVPIEGSASVGPAHAKVTIVEAFEFA